MVHMRPHRERLMVRRVHLFFPQVCRARATAARSGQIKVWHLDGRRESVSQDQPERHDQNQPGTRPDDLRATQHRFATDRCCRVSPLPTPQTALQKLPINVPRSASTEALHSVLVKDGEDITPRDALSAFAAELLPPPPPPSGARRSPPAVKEQLLNGSQDDELPIEADAVRRSACR